MTINGFKIRHRVLCPKYKSNKIKGVVLNRVFILGFFGLNCIRVSRIPKYWSSNSPSGHVFLPLQQFSVAPGIDLLITSSLFCFSRPSDSTGASFRCSCSPTGETIKHVYFFLRSTGLFAHHLWLNFFNVACQCDGLFKLTQYRISRIWHGHKN